MDTVLDLGTRCMALPENWKNSIPVLQHCNWHGSTAPLLWQTLCLSSNSVSDPKSEALGQTLKSGFLLCGKEPESPVTLGCNHGFVPSISAKVSRTPKFPVLKLCFGAKKSHL